MAREDCRVCSGNRFGAYIATIFLLGLAVSNCLEASEGGARLLHSSAIPLSLLSCLAIGSAFDPRLKPLLSLAILGAVPVATLCGIGAFVGLAFALFGAMLVAFSGFKYKWEKLRMISLVLFVSVSIVAPSAIGHAESDSLGTGLLAAILFGFSVLAYARMRPSIPANSIKSVFNLAEHGLVGKEILYLRGTAEGQSAKEIAVKYGVANSTVRNTISAAYQKLGIHKAGEFQVLIDKYHIQ